MVFANPYLRNLSVLPQRGEAAGEPLHDGLGAPGGGGDLGAGHAAGVAQPAAHPPDEDQGGGGQDGRRGEAEAGSGGGR